MTGEQHPWRATAAVVVLLVPAVGQLADALLGGSLVDFPPLLLLAAASGYAVGAWTPPRAAIVSIVTAAGLLTAASEVFDPHEYPVLDDLFFFLLVIGAPALAGAAVAGRARQVRELRRLAGLLEAQHESEVRAARLRERNRVEADLHRGFSEQIAAIVMRAESAATAAPAERQQGLADVEATARATLDDLRSALGTLRDRAESTGPAPRVGDLGPPEGRDVPTRGAGSPCSRRHAAPVDWRDAGLALAVGLAIGVEGGVSPDARGPALANLLLGVAVGVPLAWRRSRPATAAALSLAALTVMSLWLTPTTAMVTTIVPILVVPYAAGAHARTWRHRLLTLGTGAAGAWCAVLASPAELRDPEGSWPMLVWAALAFGAGLATGGWSERAAAERRVTAELSRGHEVALGLVVAEQRAALARDLHDTVAHAMTVVCLQASAGRVPGVPTDEVIGTVLAAARQGLAELRNGLDAMGDDDALDPQVLADHARSVGLSPEVRLTGDLAATRGPVRAVAVRVLREAVVNAGRYAPGAGIVLSVAVEGHELRVEVVDDGPAPDERPRPRVGAGSGLAGLAEEVRRVGGLLSSGPDPGGGYRVSAVLPLVRTLEPAP